MKLGAFWTKDIPEVRTKEIAQSLTVVNRVILCNIRAEKLLPTFSWKLFTLHPYFEDFLQLVRDSSF